MKGTQVAEKTAPTEGENVVVEGETVDVEDLRQQIAAKDEQVFILTEMLTDYQNKHAQEELNASNLRASLKFERERFARAAASQ